jgi:hypothetical protein
MELYPDSAGYLGYKLSDNHDVYNYIFYYERYVTQGTTNDYKFLIKATDNSADNNPIGLWVDFNPVLITFTYTAVELSELESKLPFDSNQNTFYVE